MMLVHEHIHVERHPEPPRWEPPSGPSHAECTRELERTGRLVSCLAGRADECMALLLAESGWSQ